MAFSKLPTGQKLDSGAVATPPEENVSHQASVGRLQVSAMNDPPVPRWKTPEVGGVARVKCFNQPLRSTPAALR